MVRLPDLIGVGVLTAAFSRRLRRKGVTGAGIPGIEVRVIEYTVAGDPGHPLGAGQGSELFCLVTTLVDARRYPMQGRGGCPAQN